MTKFTRDFFDKKEILFLGVSNKYKMFCNMAFKAFGKNNIKIIPMNNEPGDFEFKVYKDFSELPKIPDAAYTIMDTDDNRNILKQLKDKGIKKLLFHSKRIIDQNVISKCNELGIEISIACPLMIYGSGIHRIHGFFTGIK